MDILELRALLATASPAMVDRALDDYDEILGALDDVLRTQRDHDVGNLEAAIGRTFAPDEREEVARVQLAVLRDAFLLAGLRHRELRAEIARMSPGGLGRLDARIAALEAAG